MHELFQGMDRTDYQDVLRTIGHYIDENGFTGIRLIETEDGLILQGRISVGGARGEKKTETYRLSIEDIRELMRDAYARRGVAL
jgi:hypothetical protein